MDFIREAISDMVGGHDDRQDERPHVQPPWVAHWDGEAGSWIFINEATGERTFQKPVIEEAEANMERHWDDGVHRAESFPEDAAHWTGEAVGSAEHGFDRAEEGVEHGFEHAGESVEHGWHSTVDAVEHAPENMAEGIGEGVGRVEHFGDSVENFGERLEENYEHGRDEERYD